jgi:hypothetical protein
VAAHGGIEKKNPAAGMVGRVILLCERFKTGILGLQKPLPSLT